MDVLIDSDKLLIIFLVFFFHLFLLSVSKKILNPVRCAHNPPPCQIRRQVSSKTWSQCASDWAVILRAWGSDLKPGQSFWRPGELFSGFLGWLWVFIEKHAFADPLKGTQYPFFTFVWFDAFLEFCMFWMFVI